MADVTMVPTYHLALSAAESSFLMTVLRAVEFADADHDDDPYVEVDAANHMLSGIADALGKHRLQDVTFPSKLALIAD